VRKLYQRRLIRLQDERETALELVSFVHDNWYSQSFFNEAAFRGRTLADVTRLAENLDTTFTTALFAAFEGILREHNEPAPFWLPCPGECRGRFSD